MSTREAIATALTSVVTSQHFKVPPYPAVALRLQRLLEGDRYSLADVSELVATDAALAATVLSAANSAVLGTGDPITSLSRAVSRLGARMVGAIALASGVSAAAVSPGVLLDVKFRVWRRTMTCALICRELAKTRGLAPEEAFLAGLLHGFGRSIAVRSLEQVLANQPALELPVDEWLTIAEEQRAALGRAVARSWQLPSPLAEAIDDQDRGRSQLHDLVSDADVIAHDVEQARVPSAVRAEEASALEGLLKTLPGSLDAFSNASSAASKLTTSARSAVTKPDYALTGELRRVTFPVADRWAKSRTELTAFAIAPLGIEVHSSRRYQECAVVRLAIGEGDSELEPWFTVELCVAEGARFRVELQLFSAPREVRERWLALYEAAAIDTHSAVHRTAAARDLPASSRGRRADGGKP
jgi:HD-like signal output (HDOD) protein